MRSPPGPGGKLPRIRIGFYDAAKDEKLPPVKTPKKEGDDCPLKASFSQADRESFIASLLGKSEAEAGFFLAFRECRSSVVYQDDRSQDADPYVMQGRPRSARRRARAQADRLAAEVQRARDRPVPSAGSRAATGSRA